VKVGVVDDHDDGRYLMRCWLESQNHEVQDWARGRDLIEYLDREDLHLALVDLWLPDMDGLSVPEIIRSRSKRALPLVAVTARAGNNVREQVLAAGFQEYVVKPIDFDALKRVIDRILQEVK
jgi:CheY-like chemotaxis protein